MNTEKETLEQIIKKDGVTIEMMEYIYEKQINRLLEENEDLKRENEKLRKENEKLNNKNNKLHYKPQIWFTQDIILKDKEAGKVAKAIEQDLKKGGIKYD